jgi:hypothetical protein
VKICTVGSVRGESVGLAMVEHHVLVAAPIPLRHSISYLSNNVAYNSAVSH